jgi:hypothetical protein
MPATASAYQPPHALRSRRDEASWLSAGRRIKTSGDLSGRIIGFYRTDTPTALVDLDAGGSRQFLLHELRP